MTHVERRLDFLNRQFTKEYYDEDDGAVFVQTIILSESRLRRPKVLHEILLFSRLIFLLVPFHLPSPHWGNTGSVKMYRNL